MKRWLLLVPILLLLAAARLPAQTAERVVIGSKAFPESWILGEAMASLARQAGATAVHKSNLGGTEIVYAGLQSGAVDVYAEYTGTISEVILKTKARPSLEEMRRSLAPKGIGISDSLGFNDGYALAVTAATQEKYGLRKISDLAAHPDLKLGFTHEFVGRKDGWLGLSQAYGLTMPNVRGIQHELAYQAIGSGQIDVMEIYTTDAQIEKLGLKLLEDDRGFFPRYDAVLLYRLDLPKRAPRAFAAMERLVGKIDEARMTRANALVALEKQTQQQAAAALLVSVLGAESRGSVAKADPAGEMWANTLRHLELVGISLALSILIGIPLGILATRSRMLGTLTLSGAGLLQTIPSLALLAILIPKLGIETRTALVALVLYSLLPIVRNTYVGLTTIPPSLLEAAEALGLSPSAQLLKVRLPMATPAIMAGIKTSAVINVGTATLAALIGAGGLGEPILRGISLVNNDLILQGAVPAAVLALLVQGAFDLLERVVVPRGLRLTPRGE
jgi:osmoprotectant transport system permease protein